MCYMMPGMNPELVIRSGEAYAHAREMMEPEEIDHHGNGNGLDDLYLKVTPASQWIVRHLEANARRTVTVFIDQVTGTEWYDLPLMYPASDNEDMSITPA